TRAQLFAAAMIVYPKWYDPYRDSLCELEEAIATLEAEARCWREDRHGWQADGMRLWKRAPLQAIFGIHRRMSFGVGGPDGQRAMGWASQAERATEAVHVEDGFLRSRGLGAELVPPLSLVLDDLGIYYDPGRESRLERLISLRAQLRPDQQLRAER